MTQAAIAMTGTGLLTQALARRLHGAGERVVVYSRSPDRVRDSFPPGVELRAWRVPEPEDGTSGTGQDQGEMELPAQTKAVVSLAGQPVAQRWNARIKRAISSSRVCGTQLVGRAMARLDTRPSVFISASGVSVHGRTYLAEVCRDWEAAAHEAGRHAERTAIFRIAVVLAREGGALAKMLPAFRMGVGGPLGDGRAHMPWIHIDDLVDAFQRALVDDALSGIVEAVAPESVDARTFAQTLGRVLGRPALLPVPGFALRMLLGEGAEPVLESLEVAPEQLQSVGFDFRFARLESALADLCGA